MRHGLQHTTQHKAGAGLPGTLQQRRAIRPRCTLHTLSRAHVGNCEVDCNAGGVSHEIEHP